MTTKAQLHKALKTILAKALAGMYGPGKQGSKSGICAKVAHELTGEPYFDNLSEKDRAKIKKLFASWPKFSGDEVYPIPAPRKGSSSHDYYMHDEKLWKGRQLKLRLELLEHMIRETAPKPRKVK